MKYASTIRLIAGILLGFVVLMIPVIACLLWWHHLSMDAKKAVPRLQYLFVASRPMERGHHVAISDLEFRIYRRPDGEDLVQIPADIIGSFVISDHIADGEILEKNYFQVVPKIEVPPGGAVVPVEVSQSHIGGLRPGMRLVFVNEKGMAPTYQNLDRKKAKPTFILLSIAISPLDKNVASLLIEVEKCHMPLVKALGTGTWRPIIVQDASAPR